MGNFLVDTNFFIQAHRAYYPLDVVPSFWRKMKDLADRGIISSIDKVKDEIFNNQDDLKGWCETNLPDDFFKDSSTAIGSYTSVVNWAMSRSDHYLQRAIDEFLEAAEADAWLVAYALENQMTLVTYEVSAPNTKKKIKIPEACTPFSLPFVNTIEMMRQLNESF